MISTANSAMSFPSMLAPTGVFGSFGVTVSEERGAGSAGIGVSTSTAPLISAPATRQAPGFQASIAPPTRPTDPAIAPPTEGSGDQSLSGTGASMNGTLAKLAYIAALKLEMASSGGNSPSGSKNSILAMAGTKGNRSG